MNVLPLSVSHSGESAHILINPVDVVGLTIERFSPWQVLCWGMTYIDISVLEVLVLIIAKSATYRISWIKAMLILLIERELAVSFEPFRRALRYTFATVIDIAVFDVSVRMTLILISDSTWFVSLWLIDTYIGRIGRV